MHVQSAQRLDDLDTSEMDLSQLRVCKRDNGNDWVLGQGTFGTVRSPNTAPYARHSGTAGDVVYRRSLASNASYDNVQPTSRGLKPPPTCPWSLVP